LEKIFPNVTLFSPQTSPGMAWDRNQAPRWNCGK